MTVPILIDTSTLSYYLKPNAEVRWPALVARVDAAMEENGLLVSSVTVYEIERGLRLLEVESQGATKRRLWDLLLSTARVVGLDEPALQPWLTAADLYVEGMRKQPALQFGEADLLIVATSIAYQMTLLTSDNKLFTLCQRLNLGGRVEYIA